MSWVIALNNRSESRWTWSLHLIRTLNKINATLSYGLWIKYDLAEMVDASEIGASIRIKSIVAYLIVVT